jgi:FkbH-like protein
MSALSRRRNEIGDLGYLELNKAFDELCSAHNKTLRLAILADFAPQQLTPLLKVLVSRRGFALEVYEGCYDTIEFEILNPQSGLYQFQSQYIAVLHSTQKLKAKLYATADRSVFVDETIERLTSLWSAIRKTSPAMVVQSNFVIPSERAFGNYELKVESSIGALFAEVNHRLAAEARKHNNVLLCDIDFLAGEIGRANWFDERLWSMAKTFCNLDHLPRFAKGLVDIVLAAQGTVVKCVVLDLDNTLWGGVIGDDGLSGIVLGDSDEGESFVAFQRFLLELKSRGIILAVVSKNEHANAVLPFREHPNMALKESDIAVFVANWDNKADNIRLVQKTLNIGFDSMVFIDDNPFERNIVREFIPEVIVPEMPDDPADFVRILADLNLFETASYSTADRQRADQYRDEAQRRLTRSHFTDINEYLRSLKMILRLERFAPAALPRIAQLGQRSNQFNLTTRRYHQAACEALMNDPQAAPFTVTLADKFGDYGLICVVVLKIAEGTLVIDEFLMSCRVLQRGVEQYAMNRIVEFARRNGLAKVVGHYICTAKNDMVKSFFAGFGFEKTTEDEKGDAIWELAVDSYQQKETCMADATSNL